MTSGQTFVGTTTLAAILDAVYATRSGALTSASATFTALDPVTLQIGWAGKDDLVTVRFETRPLPPETITF